MQLTTLFHLASRLRHCGIVLIDWDGKHRRKQYCRFESMRSRAETNCSSELVESTGRAIAQMVSRWLPTEAARLRARLWPCGICGGQSGVGEDFSEYFNFPCQFALRRLLPQSSSSFIVRGWYNRPVSGRRTKWTQSHPIENNNKEYRASANSFTWCVPENIAHACE
jgi:hypothetical protein